MWGASDECATMQAVRKVGAAVERAGRFVEMGLVAAGMSIEGRDRAEWCDNVENFGVDVIAKVRG